MATLNFGDHLTNFLELMGTIKRTFQTVKVMLINSSNWQCFRIKALCRGTTQKTHKR